MQQGSRRLENRSQGRWPVALALAAALALWLSVPGLAAASAIDQQQPTASVGPLLTKAMAQTFTAGVSGRLDHVSLHFGPTSGATGWVEIRSVDSAGKPAGTALGGSSDQVAFTASTFRSPYYDFYFPAPITLAAGTQYALVVAISIGSRAWMGAGINVYAGGQGWIASCPWCTNWAATTSPKDFAFETWMTTAVDQAPTVASNNSAVSVDEGTAPANSGTFSDPDGDTVAITASSGSVTKSGTSNGTWAWAQAASDEAPQQTITITAKDGSGLTSTSSFTVTVAGVSPTVSIGSGTFAAASLAAAAATSPEGTAVTLSGSASSPAVADNSTGFTYSWSVSKNGSPFGAGTGASFSFTPDDEGTFVATLTATDDGGMSGVASATVLGGNVAPAAAIASVTPSVALVTTTQEPLSFAGSFSDPGALDSHTVTWSFGDGSTVTSSYGPGGSADLSATHSYAAAGTYLATLTVTDDDGGVGQASTKVVIQTVQQALSSIAAYVQTLPGLNAGQKNSLIAKLNAASAAATRGDATAAHNELNAFLNELQADVNAGNVSAASAATLRAAVHAVEAALGTYNRLLDWWPLAA